MEMTPTYYIDYTNDLDAVYEKYLVYDKRTYEYFGADSLQKACRLAYRLLNDRYSHRRNRDTIGLLVIYDTAKMRKFVGKALGNDLYKVWDVGWFMNHPCLVKDGIVKRLYSDGKSKLGEHQFLD